MALNCCPSGMAAPLLQCLKWALGWLPGLRAACCSGSCGQAPLLLPSGPVYSAAASFPQGHICHLQDLVSPSYAYLWTRPTVLPWAEDSLRTACSPGLL